MINVITIILITTTLVITGVYSPNPEKPINGGEKITVKNGYGAVVVEYADDTSGAVVVEYADVTSGGDTKVKISPSKMGEDLGQAQKAQEAHNGPYGAGTRELICDAYGKCKHKLASGWSRAKEKVIESEEEVKEKVSETVNKVKDKVEECTQVVRRNAKEKVEKAEEIAGRVKEKLSERVSETMSEVKGESKEAVKQKGEMGKMRLFDIVKRGKDLVLGSIGYVLRVKWVFPLMGIVQIMGFSIAYGTSIWVTFIMSHVLVGVLQKQQFGMVQSKIYPVYFRTMAVSIVLALVGHLLGERGNMFENKAEMFQCYNLMSLMLSVLANLMFLEPKATKVMFQRIKMEKEEGRGRRDEAATLTRVVDTTESTATSAGATRPRTRLAEKDEWKDKRNKVEERLNKLNSLSSLLNVMTLMGLTWHLVYLSHRINAFNPS